MTLTLFIEVLNLKSGIAKASSDRRENVPFKNGGKQVALKMSRAYSLGTFTYV
jgi:hypothetical protein